VVEIERYFLSRNVGGRRIGREVVKTGTLIRSVRLKSQGLSAVRGGVDAEFGAIARGGAHPDAEKSSSPPRGYGSGAGAHGRAWINRARLRSWLSATFPSLERR
jgi:hypothetical protein